MSRMRMYVADVLQEMPLTAPYQFFVMPALLPFYPTLAQSIGKHLLGLIGHVLTYPSRHSGLPL